MLEVGGVCSPPAISILGDGVVGCEWGFHACSGYASHPDHNSLFRRRPSNEGHCGTYRSIRLLHDSTASGRWPGV